MSHAVGFEPVAQGDARVLILGSMPGQQSLARQEYYGNAQNSFWRIMQTLFNAPAKQSYESNRAMLIRHRIALWDVIDSCSRPGSLDSSIVAKTIVANNFARFFAGHPHIATVFFNGARAAEEFRKRVLPDVSESYPKIQYVRLLSTSPANARYSYEQKLANWSYVLDHLGITSLAASAAGHSSDRA